MKKHPVQEQPKDRIALIKEALKAKKAKIGDLPQRAAPKAAPERSDVRSVRSDWSNRESFYREVRKWGIYGEESPRSRSSGGDMMRELKEFGI